MNGLSEELLHRLHRERHSALDQEAERMAELRRALANDDGLRATHSLRSLLLWLRRSRRRIAAAADFDDPGLPLRRLQEVVAAKSRTRVDPLPALRRWRFLGLISRR
ncbi:MAG TPA: hypothetical protein VF168_02325 [Trueperaceae bacterium]